MPSKTKAQLETELAALKKIISEQAKPKPQQKDNPLNEWLPMVFGLVIIAVIAYTDNGASPSPKPPPPEPRKSISKVLDEAYAADRSSKADVLSEAASKSWNSDQAKLNWINEQAEKKRVLDFRQFYERVAQALVDGTDAQIAEQIRSKK